MEFQFDVIIRPFLVAFVICWTVFCLLLILKPRAWFKMQNRHTKAYGYEWRITNEKKFDSTHKRAGILLLVFGAIFTLILIARLITI